ncbi:hypothetical protein F4780DRAFT_781344 [Xylariomycetidae sp. FL0641]|nr:hypothetical protein F4780DRAFT_781344 [Xylariomycetidae sp. FL0641]
MAGFLVPPWYKADTPGRLDMNIASLIWGMSLMVASFAMAKATRQTWTVWKRRRGVNSYIVMVWLELISSLIISVIVWFYLWGTIPASFELFFTIITLWVFQTQCVIQIIINRIALLVRDQRKVNRTKWGVGCLLGLVNISVYCIWIPARLQINEQFVTINEYWDRIEKVIFCLIDVTLNLYFIYSVRSRLIANGLKKYNKLFYFNLAMIALSMSLDVILIGVMSLGQGFIYAQFHPLVYCLKLHIELHMADLISKVVRIENHSDHRSGSKPTGSKSHGTRADPRNFQMATHITANRDFQYEEEDIDLKARPRGGIKVETEVRHTSDVHASDVHALDGDSASRTSSTAGLQYGCHSAV